MDDEELIKQFIRTERREYGVEITVCEIDLGLRTDRRCVMLPIA
tara:strand:+ start:163 stop:294 length:132 start_codon:yes stop_codon:yes gene_type:complete